MKKLFVVLFLFVFMAVPAIAQLEVKVTDPYNRTISGSDVVLIDAGARTFQGTTNSSGLVKFSTTSIQHIVGGKVNFLTTTASPQICTAKYTLVLQPNPTLNRVYTVIAQGNKVLDMLQKRNLVLSLGSVKVKTVDTVLSGAGVGFSTCALFFPVPQVKGVCKIAAVAVGSGKFSMYLQKQLGLSPETRLRLWKLRFVPSVILWPE